MSSLLSRATVLAAAIALAAPAAAIAEGDTIVLGSAISITGKYSQEGRNARDGYDFAVKKINDAGGVKINRKTYKLEIKYYDDESTPARTAQLLERLINQDGVKFPMPMLADPGLEYLKRYRAFDDFENQPLHGAFLIDGQGRLRWLDISYDPFTDVRFLLKEARRLLALPVAGS